MTKKQIINSVLWGAVAVVLVWFSLRGIDWKEFGTALRQCRWGWVLLAMVFGAGVFAMRGMRWWLLLHPIDKNLRRVSVFNAYNICNFANLAIPRSGELVRIGYVMKHSSTDENGKRLLGMDKILGTVVVERMWDLIVVTAMCAGLVIAQWDNFGQLFVDGIKQRLGAGAIWWLTGGTVILAAALLCLLWRLREKGGFWTKAWGFMQGIGHGLQSCLHMERAWLFLLDTALLWGFYGIVCYCIARALQDIPAFDAMTMADSFLVMISGTVSSLVPVPGGFGAYHSVVSAFLQKTWGISASHSMIYATLNHESHALVQALIGLWSYIHENFIDRRK